jgi:hypothetical protein
VVPTLLGCVGLISMVVELGAGAPPAPEITPVRIPGGVADPDGAVGYLASSNRNSVDAIDLNVGRTLWTSLEIGQPLQPLIAWDRRLAIRVGTSDQPLSLRICILDTRADLRREQRSLKQWNSFPLPAWVSVTGSQRSSLQFSAPRVADGRLLLTWSASVRTAFGVDPLGLRTAPASHQATGTLILELDSGSAKTDPARPEAHVPPLHNSLARVTSYPYQQDGQIRSDALTNGRYLAALEKEVTNATLVLRFWDRETGHAQPPVLLGVARDAAVLRTLDSSSLLVQDRPGRSGAASRCVLIALSPGARAVEIQVNGTVESAAVIGNRAYMRYAGAKPGASTASWTLAALSLPEGHVRWTLPVEMTVPPAQRPKRPE